MIRKKFLLLESNPMFLYTLNDIDHMENVVIYHKKCISKNKLLNLVFNIHNSGKIQKYFNLPYKSIWDKILFNKILKSFTPDYVIFTNSWYSDHLIKYFQEKCQNCKLIFRFSDMVSNCLGENYRLKITKIRSQFNGVLVYSQEDAEEYGFTYHSVGYSTINRGLLKPCKKYDVVFIGAEKGRIDKIRQAYFQFKAAGLSCFFYVTMVKKGDRKNDGIIYADKIMPFCDYLSYEIAAKCLFEIVQDGSSGRTFRMMESIMYNKLLITNCTEIVQTDYYKPEYVQLYNEVSEIDPSFIKNSSLVIEYHYKGDFSPIRVLEFVERNW